MNPHEIFVKKRQRLPTGTVRLTSSKSESNRALLIQALAQKPVQLERLSAARDTKTMQKLLATKGQTWDVGDAGTTMRFLTAYLALKGRGEVLTGTPRMQQRPIGILVDALRGIGARIEYMGAAGVPPLRIWAIQKQSAHDLDIPGNISSQYISALLMVAPILPDGLTLHFTTEVFSRPYIAMTLGLMKHFGVEHDWTGNRLHVAPHAYQSGSYTVESDWSGASYWYSLVALADEGAKVLLPGLRRHSLQGDQAIAKMMRPLGVETTFTEAGASIQRTAQLNHQLKIDFRDTPDLAQTVLVTSAALGVHLELTGIESLRIKETDRITAMQTELAKIGARLVEEGDAWQLIPGYLPEHAFIDTYEDHRMAMAFAPLCQKMNLTIADPGVVQKSYPNFWEELAAITGALES